VNRLHRPAPCEGRHRHQVGASVHPEAVASRAPCGLDPGGSGLRRGPQRRQPRGAGGLSAQAVCDRVGWSARRSDHGASLGPRPLRVRVARPHAGPPRPSSSDRHRLVVGDDGRGSGRQGDRPAGGVRHGFRRTPGRGVGRHPGNLHPDGVTVDPVVGPWAVRLPAPHRPRASHALQVASPCTPRRPHDPLDRRPRH